MEFSFSFSDVKQSGSKYLRAYNIYSNVTLDGVEIKEGTSAKGNKWKAMYINFSCPEGSYNHSIFYPMSDKDFERREQEMPNGGKRQYPSNWEQARNTMAAIGFTFFPEDFTKMQEASAKATSFEQIASMFIKCVEKNKGKVHTNMKLVGKSTNGSVYAALPSCVGIAEANTPEKAANNNVNVGEWYTWMVSPFGDKLFLNDHEKNAKKALEEAKPTNMDNAVTVEPVEPVETANDIDFDSLL